MRILLAASISFFLASGLLAYADQGLFTFMCAGMGFILLAMWADEMEGC